MADTMQGLKRTHYCGEVTAQAIGETVTVCGWVQKIRDKGHRLDLRFIRTGTQSVQFSDNLLLTQYFTIAQKPLEITCRLLQAHGLHLFADSLGIRVMMGF